MKKHTLIICIAFFVFSLPLMSQVKDTAIVFKDTIAANNDSLAIAKQNRKKIYAAPRRAAIMSAVLPGLGQAYNKKYWKIPIIYAGLGGFAYLFISNNKEYKFYRKNLIADNDGDSSTINTTGYSSDQLLLLKTQYRKSRDLGIIGMGIIYLINIIDANVDAHLKTFDVSDDLSLHVEPWQNVYRAGGRIGTAAGLSFKLTFK